MSKEKKEIIEEALAFAERWDWMPAHERSRMAPSIEIGEIIRSLVQLLNERDG